MPIKTLPQKSISANTWTKLGASYPSVPGTLILSSGNGQLWVGPDGTDANTWFVVLANAQQPVQVYVDNIAEVYVKGDGAAGIYCSYYPATETPVSPR